ncbi:MAG: MBL fold metallo-hydrolase [bacterium]
MHKITQDVYQFDELKSGQCYLIVENNGVALIDTGMMGDYKKIASQMKQQGFQIEDINYIILTHCHSDHTANVKKIQDISHATLIAHEAEKPYIEQTAKLQYSSFGKRVGWGILNTLFAIKGIRVDKTVDDGDILEIFGGLQVIHTPGHTPGSMALYQPDRKVLFSGDSLINEGKLAVCQGFYNIDDHELSESVKKLRDIEIDIICVGHGQAILEKGAKLIRELFV